MTEPQLFQALKESLIAAGRGPFFPDWEFPTLLGFERAEMIAIADSFTAATPIRGEVLRAINSSLVNLLGYPHGEDFVHMAKTSSGASGCPSVLINCRLS